MPGADASETPRPSDAARVQAEEIARVVARQEISSLMGMMLRRLQEEGPTRSGERNMAVEVLSRLVGEALRDFGATRTEPGA